MWRSRFAFSHSKVKGENARMWIGPPSKMWKCESTFSSIHILTLFSHFYIFGNVNLHFHISQNVKTWISPPTSPYMWKYESPSFTIFHALSRPKTKSTRAFSWLLSRCCFHSCNWEHNATCFRVTCPDLRFESSAARRLLLPIGYWWVESEEFLFANQGGKCFIAFTTIATQCMMVNVL